MQHDPSNHPARWGLAYELSIPTEMKKDRSRKKNGIRYRNANRKHFAVQRSPGLSKGWY
ncbi:hypothetical protein [Rhodopirellula sp. P2]|uniref:hypothetical protein n=1 Tax=Rhodopirellula sp. P2 TaxID=2127060 RepID=UPI003FD5A2E3